MARKSRQGRGVSFGTIFVLSFSLLTLFVGGLVFLRISGDIEQITIDPKLLAEPLAVLARTVTNIEPAAGGGGQAGGEADLAVAVATATATLAPTPTPEPTPPPNRTLTLRAVGQITLGAELRNAGLDRSAGSYAFDALLAPVSGALSGADLSIATMRTLLSESSSDFDAYCGPPAIITSLRASGVNLFNFATDRLLDQGVSGLERTRSLLEGLQASSAGMYRNQEERQNLSVRDIGGVKVGILPYTASISPAGSKAASGAQIDIATRMLSLNAAAADIAEMRAKGANMIVVLAHWGNRADTKPSKETRDMADALINAGADIILGTNPTSVHEVERRTVTNEAGESRDVFIAYSLGNFLIDDSRETPNITGMILGLDIEWNAQLGRVTINDAWYIPTWIMRWKDSQGVNRYQVVPAGASEIPEHMTDSIYVNMKKAYQNMAQKLGEENARLRPE